ncbi:MAG: TonB-dependent receptor, partial [Xanthomonadaceae bacterium]|nr:TonB-dependent receptor [Xanthomonadaceae bacterium]
MLLKRNAMTLALISAGIGLMACTDYALAADTVAAGAQDQTQPQAKSAAADQDNKAQDKKKNEKAAAEKQTTQLQEINVKGYAGSLQNATAIKRNSDEIVEAVSAEQIGKLPG